jgi:hypothetical protein
MAEASIPQGWQRLSDWCIRSDDGAWTVCRVFVTGWVYELWHLKNQIAVGMFTQQDAIRLHHTSITATSREAGAKSSQSLGGDQAGFQKQSASG